MPTEQSLQELWEYGEALRKSITDHAMSLSADQQAKSPNPKREFSPAQMVKHMAIVEQVYLGLLAKTPSSKPHRVARKNLIYKMIQRICDKGKRVPTIREMEPPPTIALNQAIVDWHAVRAELGAKLKSGDPDELWMKHPMLGWLSRRLTLEIVNSHCIYHCQLFPYGPIPIPGRLKE